VTDSVGQSTRLLAGRYKIGELIGRGGMADVRLGTDARLGRRVAIKLLKPTLANDPAFRTRFRREAQDAAKMAHPTIVRIFDAGEETVTDPNGNEAQIPFIVMEYVDGRLLKDIIAEGPLEPAEAVRIIEQVLTALEYSHRAGVVHRDIKPGNIMITSNGQVKVMDFGIARAISESSATIAETSAIVGTAQYFSPEQARGEAVDARTDLYSAGVVLFELLTGRAPFQGENPVAVAYQHVNQNAVPPSTLNPKVSPALDAVVLRALSKDRFARFQSAAEFRAEVASAADGAAPARKSGPTSDFNATLFGVNPQATAGSEATLRQLTVDQDAARAARTQTRPPVAWIWAGIVLTVVIIVAVVFWTLTLPRDTGFSDGLSVKVPSLAGQTSKSADARLKKLGLIPTDVTQASNTVDSGDVIRTVPDAGQQVGSKTPITVYVSNGKVAVTVPNLTGQTPDQAKTALGQLKLVVGSSSQQDSPTVPKGVIISSSPAAGANASQGDKVQLVVSTGLVDVPSVVGLSGADANAALSPLQLDVNVTTNNGCSGGTVSSQSLPQGEQPQGSTITITVCTGS
jgi:serine/threonine protein kinase